MSEENGIKLNVEATLPVLRFGVEDMKAEAIALAEKYKGLVITEDMVAEVRKDMAYLNKVADALDRARIDTVKSVSAPIRIFEAQVKEVVGIITEARGSMAAQVQAHVDAAREAKRQVVENIIAKAFQENPMDTPFTVDVRDSWLVASTANSKVKAEVVALLEGEKKRRADHAALERAKDERGIAIETKALALEAHHGLTLPRFNFVRYLGLDVPLADALEGMEAAYDKAAKELAAKKEAEQVPLPAESTNLIASPATTASGPEAKPAMTDHLIEFHARCTKDKLEEVRVLLRQVFHRCTGVSVKIT